MQEQELEGKNKRKNGRPLKQNYIRKRKKKLYSSGLPPIGRKEIRKAERFRRIHKKRYESNIA